MKKRSLIAGIAALPMALSGACLADQFVIAHSSVNISENEIREAYLGEKQFASGVKLVLVDNAALQDLFLARVLRMGASKYDTAWIKKSFRDGLIAPSVRPGDAETIEFVRRTPGAIGYVAASKPPTGVNVISKF